MSFRYLLFPNLPLFVLLLTLPILLRAQAVDIFADSIEYWELQADNAQTEQQAEEAYHHILEAQKHLKDSNAWRKTQMARANLYDAADWGSPVDLLDEALNEVWWKPDRNVAYLNAQLGYYAELYGEILHSIEARENAYQLIKSGDAGLNYYLVLNVLRPLGNLYSVLGELQKARLVLEDGYRFFEENDEQDMMEDMAFLMSDLAICYRTIGDLDLAKLRFTEGLNLPGLGPETRTLLQINLAETLLLMKDLKGSKVQARSAIAIMEKTPDIENRDRNLAGAYSILGAIFSAEGKYTEAKLALDNAIKAGLLASPEPFSRELSGWYLQRAGIKGRLGELESALRDCQLSLQKILPGYQSSGPLALGDARYYSPENRLWETFTLQGNLLYQWFEKANREDYLFAALRAHEAAMEVEALQLRALAYDESSLNLLASNRQQKNEAVAIAWRLWQLQPSPERYFKVLSIAERSRSLMLQDRKRQLDLMAGRQADPVLVSSLDEVDSLMAVAQVALRDLDPASIGYLQQEVMIDSLVSRKQQLKASLSLASPLYASARFGDLTFSLKDLQLGLPEGVLVASYFLGEGEMFLFGISHDHTDLLRIPLEKDLLAQINELYASVTSPYMGQPSSLGKYDDIRRRLSLHLYEQVLQPLTSQLAFSGLSRLWIIPDGIIGRVPFALLHTAPFSGKYYAEEPFLVKSMALGMANNLTLLFLQMNGTVSAEEAELLCVAPSYQSMGGGGSRAVGTELALPVPQGVRLVFHLQEANYLHRRYGGGFLFESKATVPQFLDEVEHYSLLHFSGHAQPDSATGLWNFLALEAEAGSYDAFAPFWQPQILALRMQAQMVFLSACETSRGKFYQGEGHSSLARAFLYGGASSVVATLWQIDDSVSLRFAERFYLNLEQGLSKDVTMQQTMLSMIAENRPPYAWAPYLLWGDAREISLSPQQPLWPYVLVIAVLLALLGGIYLRVRIRKREL